LDVCFDEVNVIVGNEVVKQDETVVAETEAATDAAAAADAPLLFDSCR
jgi:hypothetical protein